MYILSTLKFVKGIQEYYAASSSTLVQNSSCIVDDDVLHPCATLDVLISDYTFTSATGNGNISIYLIHDRYFVFKNLSLSFYNLNVVEILSWKKENQTNIECSGDFSIEYVNVRIIYVQSIKFYQCGKLKPVIGLSNDSSTTEIVMLKNSVFANSRCSSVQILCDMKQLHISDCLFDGNLDDYGIYVCMNSSFLSSCFNNTTTTIRDTMFMNNAAGSLYFFSYQAKATLKIQNSSFMNITSSIDNSGKVTSSEVIGIYSIADIYINSSTFFHNSPSSMVVVECHKNLCDTTTTSLVVNNSHFISNIERVGGGLHISKYMFIEIYNSIFTGNRVTKVGGVLYILFSTSLLISNCSFLWNNAARHGGVIYLRGVTGVSFHLSTFTGNNAVRAGGAVVIYSSDIVLINHCTFLRNGAHTGGALYLQHIKFVNVTDSNFSLNRALSRINIVEHCDSPITANREGGAIRGCFINHMKLNNCVFSNNAAAIGGAISTYAPIMAW